MRDIVRRLRWLRCRLFSGHLPVLRSGPKTLQHRCYLCDAPLGAGWDYTDIDRPGRTRRRRRASRRALRLIRKGRAA